MQPKRYIFKFYYIASTKFFGSQRQKEYKTIENCIINALLKTNLVGDIESSRFEAASRTDRYVSARGSAFSFISLKKPILMEINSVLPKEIGLWAYAIDFLSRFNALYRHYKYILPVTKSLYYNDKKLNFKLMRKACKKLEGSHDFRNFYKRGKEEVKTSREILLASITKEKGFLIFDFKSQAFLRQQIRRMISKILEVGMGVIDYEQFLQLFSPEFEISYRPANPRGLILWDVFYGNSVDFIIDPKSMDRMKSYFLEKEDDYRRKYNLFSLMQHNNIGE
jgi:tRNA pseudouridine(38-40) synthase